MAQDLTRIEAVLERIALALERAAPKPAETRPVFTDADGFVWEPEMQQLLPVRDIPVIPLSLLKGIDRSIAILLENTNRFAAGLPANNALLWGARGMGKSTLVKAVHADVNAHLAPPQTLALIEIHREDIDTLPALLRQLR